MAKDIHESPHTKKNQTPLAISKCHQGLSYAHEGLTSTHTTPISLCSWPRTSPCAPNKKTKIQTLVPYTASQNPHAIQSCHACGRGSLPVLQIQNKFKHPCFYSKCQLAVSMARDGLSNSQNAPNLSCSWPRHTTSPPLSRNFKHHIPLQSATRASHWLVTASL